MTDEVVKSDAVRPSRNYGAYQISLYVEGIKNGHLPITTTDSRLLEEQAKKQMSSKAYKYVAGGAGERATMDSNRLALRQWKLIPRMLRPTTYRDLSVNLFGYKYDSPVIIAPVGIQSLFHADKEVGMAEIAATNGLPFVLSTASSSTIEEVAAANDRGLEGGEFAGSRWFQLYWPRSEDTTISLLRRAKKAGFAVLVVTLDAFSLSWRPSDLDLASLPFLDGLGNAIGFSDPVFRKNFKESHSKEPEDDILMASRSWVDEAFSGTARTWEDLEFLKKHWDGPIVLKGVQCADDAQLASRYGAQGIIVSNHGGRQLDGAIGSLEVLPEIVNAVKGDMTVLFDSGIRTGTDVIKALCLGAHGVLVGRCVSSLLPVFQMPRVRKIADLL
ncbi:MAG: hypothetical protein M1814_003763 [Vezdaea aestivalis]|nr:MAG: hypothetical protein M1814_003763 [Vezdaea aestivalis]